MFCLTYVFSRNIFFNFNLKKIRTLINFQKVSGIPVTVTVTGSVTVTMSFEVRHSSGGLSTYIGNTKKNLERKVNVKFFTVDAYFCAI